MDIIQEVNQARERIVKYRQDLHRCPETAFEEYKTTAYIKRQLDAMGISYTPLHPTGIVVEIGKGRGAAALRADIDALSKRGDRVFFCVRTSGIYACLRT